MLVFHFSLLLLEIVSDWKNPVVAIIAHESLPRCALPHIEPVSAAFVWAFMVPKISSSGIIRRLGA
jgi:hypothetical protein